MRKNNIDHFNENSYLIRAKFGKFQLIPILIIAFVLLMISAISLHAEPSKSTENNYIKHVKYLLNTADEVKKNNPQDGLTLVNEALGILREHPNKDLHIQALLMLSQIQRNLGHNQAALETVNQVINIENIDKSRTEMGFAYFEKASLFRKMGEFVQAYNYALKALNIFEEEENYKQIVTIKNMIANIYMFLKDYETAFVFYEESLNIAEQNNLYDSYISTLLALARAYLEAGMPEKSREKLQEALQQDISSYDRAHAYYVMGQTYMDQENWVKALETDSIALDLSQQIQNLYLQSVVYTDFAYIYNIKDDYDKSLEFNCKALDLRRKMGSLSLVSSALRNIATLHKKYGHYSEAINSFMEALNIAEQIDDKDIQVDIHNKLAEIYELLGDTDKALYHMHKYSELKDQLYNSAVIHNVRQLQLDYMLEKKNTENELLRRNILIHELENKRQQLLILSGLIIFILLIVILILVYKRYVHSSKLADILEKKVDERTKELRVEIEERKKAEDGLKKSLQEKEVLVQEIHHRVKNNLQLITSLMNLQADEVETKEDALRGFENSRMRILSMARIYDRLFESEYLSDIELSDYIKELTSTLLYTNQLSTEISLEHHIDRIALNIASAMPIGLILNELITNVAKHAFKGIVRGKLNISLRKLDDYYELIVQDNGIGIPKEISLKEPTTLGLTIVELLTQQLHGTLEIVVENGTKVVIRFSPEKSMNGNG